MRLKSILFFVKCLALSFSTLSESSAASIEQSEIRSKDDFWQGGRSSLRRKNEKATGFKHIAAPETSSLSKLKGGTLPVGSKIENDIHPGGENRQLQPRSDVKLINNCGFDASIGIIYHSLNLRAIYLWPTIQKGRGIMLRNVSDPTIFFYGFNSELPDHVVWGSSTSKYCVSQGRCLEPRIVGNLANGLIRYKLCDTIVPTPSPIAKLLPTPSPTAKLLPTPSPTAKLLPTPSPIAKAPPTLDNNALSDIEISWLKAHNIRRNDYYTQNGLGSADLKWSKSLQKSAQNYANILISLDGDSKCTIRHGVNGDSLGGENLSKNWGTSPKTNSSTPEEILTAWFDEEINLPFGESYHATQVVFRSSRYVGCGTSEKKMYHGGKCFINVCRYLSPGNCNMSPENWKARTLEDNNLCRPSCPEEGCF